jgi:glutamate-1-semialdehyde 2,1-aminomutase
VPLYFRDGCGSRLIDVDGNQYIDYTLAWGPLILGHRHPALVEVMRHAAESPHLYGAQHMLEIEVSEKMQRAVPCAERCIFTSSGSEAVQLALRLARASTGRNLVVKFEGHYHGWMDSVLLGYRKLEGPGSAGQVPNAKDNLLILPWNDPAQVDRAFAEHGPQIAGVITEPVLCNSGCLMPDSGYLEFLRAVTRRHGALLIFDEVITGFRMALGGAQQHFSVTPDLATFGKAMAGGLPLSAVAGRADILDLMQTGGVAFGGTFNGNPVSLAAANATLTVLLHENGGALRHANHLGQQLMSGIRRLGITVTGFGAAFAVHFGNGSRPRAYRDTLANDKSRLAQWILDSLEKGIYLLPDGRIYVSAAHTEADIADSLAVFSTLTATLRGFQSV